MRRFWLWYPPSKVAGCVYPSGMVVIEEEGTVIVHKSIEDARRYLEGVDGMAAQWEWIDGEDAS